MLFLRFVNHILIYASLEPNDRFHVQNAINWYTTSCKKRTAADLTKAASFSGACVALTDGKYVQTNAISGVIDYTDQVDVYDGSDYNGYTASIATTAQDGKLFAYDYFTDQEKSLRGVDRPTFITLAPNSITKVRIYTWIEGQDVDNYDFASLGKKISVAFGFTKERFFDEDFDYVNPENAELPTDVMAEEHPAYDYVAPSNNSGENNSGENNSGENTGENNEGNNEENNG